MQSKQFDIYFSGPTTVDNDESNVRTRIQILQMPLCKQTLIPERERDRERERERERTQDSHTRGLPSGEEFFPVVNNLSKVKVINKTMQSLPLIRKKLVNKAMYNLPLPQCHYQVIQLIWKPSKKYQVLI